MDEDRKYWKRHRKEKERKDRSKYKVTDQRKLGPEWSEDESALFRITRSLPQGFEALSPEGRVFFAHLRGSMKEERGSEKNLVVVGDFVLVKPIDDHEVQILSVKPRTSILARQDNLTRKKKQTLAANIDYLVIVSSLLQPTCKPSLVDRYLIAAEKGGLKPLLVFTKVDLFEEGESSKEYLETLRACWKHLPLFIVSATTGFGMKELGKFLEGKTAVFSGQSGVGKTSLVNILAGVDEDTQSIVERSQKGAHTTSHARLFPLIEGGFCIDTPGIRSFGVWNLTADEVKEYYPEFQEVRSQCAFGDCSHTFEEVCGVKKAVEIEQISLWRYESYLALVGDLNTPFQKR